MKVFVSWSKSASKSIAEAFAAWLPRVIQECEPFISSDTEKGDAWFDTIETNLAEARVGVLFLTPQNQNAPWLNYEAGALRTLRNGNMKRLCAVFVGMKTADYNGPVKNFQMTNFVDKDDMLKLLRAINGAADRPLDERRLEDEFDEKWDRLVADTAAAVQLANAGSEGEPAPAEPRTRTVEDKLDEALDLLREMRFARTTVSKGHIRRAEEFLREERESDRKIAESILGMFIIDEQGSLQGEVVKLSARGDGFTVETDQGYRFTGTEAALRRRLSRDPF